MLPFVILGLIWLGMAPFTNRTAERESIRSRMAYVLPLAIATWLLYSPTMASFDVRLLPDSPILKALGFGLDYAGVAFAIWARFTLGKLWSGTITKKENHRLVQEGPFAITRHPIYTGILFAALGCAILAGGLRGFLTVGLLFCGFLFKSTKEERLMAATFGDTHRDYRTRVKRLIPLVW